MAITTNAICNVFKEDILLGQNNFSTSSGDVFKLALYTSQASIGADTTSFTTSNEVGNTGQYTSGGSALSNNLVSVNGTTAFVDFDDLSFTGVTLTARGALIYNTSNSNSGVAVLDFG